MTTLADITPDQAAALMRAAFGGCSGNISTIHNPHYLSINDGHRRLVIQMDSDPSAYYYLSNLQHPFNAVAVVDLLRKWGVKMEN